MCRKIKILDKIATDGLNKRFFFFFNLKEAREGGIRGNRCGQSISRRGESKPWKGPDVDTGCVFKEHRESWEAEAEEGGWGAGTEVMEGQKVGLCRSQYGVWLLL